MTNPTTLAEPAAFISFDNGVCRRLRAREIPQQVEEAIQACDAVQLGANLLNEQLKVVAHVRRCATAINGFICYVA